MIGIQPNDADEWCNLGFELHKQGRHPKAEQAYRMTAEIESDNPSAWYNLGVVNSVANLAHQCFRALTPYRRCGCSLLQNGRSVSSARPPNTSSGAQCGTDKLADIAFELGIEPEVFALDSDDRLQTAVVLPSSKLEDLGLVPFTIDFTPHMHYLANSGMCPYCLQDRWHYILGAF